MRWTEDQDDVLRAYCYLGADAVAERIWRECGVRRSAKSVIDRACRNHVSLVVRSVCPGCGATGVKINRSTGMCRRCSERQHLEEERAFRETLERERAEAEADSDEIDALHREREALRQANKRTCDKYGLPNRRERRRRGREGSGDGL